MRTRINPLIHSLFRTMPEPWQRAVRAIRYSRQISRNRFSSPEPEIGLLPELIRSGDWVIDVGANVGHYTKAFSDLVGPTGRVIAFEPVSETFALLSSNINCFRYGNVTLLNAAASDSPALASMAIPQNSAGVQNHYQAHITAAGAGKTTVMALCVDFLALPSRVSLVKVDAEGHEGFVLIGMRKLLARDRPVLILEGGAREGYSVLEEIGYRIEKLPRSPNILAFPT